MGSSIKYFLNFKLHADIKKNHKTYRVGLGSGKIFNAYPANFHFKQIIQFLIF